jgi:anaerobic magnesium-protoporphyrin IX monomethyl ester cyclase
MNKKIILVQPHYPTSPFPGPRLPVGLGCLAEQLIKRNIDYEVVDMNFTDFSSLETKILSFQPDAIGISLMSLDIQHNYAFITAIKRRFPAITLIAGGPHVSFIKEETLLDCSAIDVGIVYEGEDSLIEFIQSGSPKAIKGLIYRDSGRVVYNGDRQFIQHLDDYQFPTYRKFNLSKYDKTIAIISSRGCPFGCIFCGAHFSMGKRWRGRSVASIMAEIEFWNRQGYVHFNFVDSNFFFDKQRVISLCDHLKDRNLNVTITSDGMRGDDADSEMLKRMKAFGLRSVAIGVESANEGILKEIKKGETLRQIEKAVKTCIDLDINVTLFFIIGLPGETKKSVKNSFKFALKYPVQNAVFFNANPLPRTELYRWAEQNNYLLSSREQMFNNIGGMGNEPLIATPELSYDDRKKLYKKGLLISKKVQERFASRGRQGKINNFLKTVQCHVALRFKFLISRKKKRVGQIFTHLTHDEKLLLKDLAEQIPKGGVVVEIGSYLGASACFFSLGCHEKKGTVYCVDTWQNDAMSEGRRDTFSLFLENTKQFKKAIVPLRGKSVEIAKNFDKKIDLLFIDSDHSYEGVSSDVKAWMPHLKSGAMIVFHDYGWAEGVQKTVDELVKPMEKRAGEVVDNTYWTIVGGESNPL